MQNIVSKIRVNSNLLKLRLPSSLHNPLPLTTQRLGLRPRPPFISPISFPTVPEN